MKKALNLFTSLMAVAAISIIFSCEEDTSKPSTISFVDEVVYIDEGLKRKKITLVFEKPVSKNTSIQLAISTNESTYQEDFTTEPETIAGLLTIPVVSGAQEVSFNVSANLDLISESDEFIDFAVVNVPDGFLVTGSLRLHIVNNSLMHGLVGEYLLDGDAMDTSPTLNHGSINGALVSSDHLNSGDYALKFDGVDDFVSIPDNSTLNFGSSQDFSVSLWVSVSSTQLDYGGTINDILRKWENDTQGYPYAVLYHNNSAISGISRKISCLRTGTCGDLTPTLTPVVTTDGYHHIVYIKDGSSLKLYLDNSLVMQAEDEVVCTTTNTSPITIGCRGNGQRFFRGMVDDVRFYNRPLSENEIEKLFQI